MEITLPHKFTPREYQIPLYNYLDNGGLRGLLVWHRRAGKDKTAWNHMIKKSQERVGNYYYFFPTYTQGRKILWDGIDKNGLRALDHIPKELILKKNDQEMKITMKNGSIIQVIGTDKIDAIVGTNPVGCIFSEYSLQDPRAWKFISPILKENNGWALFVYTPRGANHGKRLYLMAKDNPKWFCQRLSVNDTVDHNGNPIITDESIQDERDEGIDEATIQQEYYCSFDAPVEGAIYAKQIREARDQGRITKVPYDPHSHVFTWWDLGMSDAMSILFYQCVGMEWRLIDCYSNFYQPLSHYVDVLNERGYKYHENGHYYPHDIKVTEMGTGVTRLETLKRLGIKGQVIPRISQGKGSEIVEGIYAARRHFSQLYIDEEKCAEFIEAISNYHWKKNERKELMLGIPDHDWSSHYADAFRGWGVSCSRIEKLQKKNQKKVVANFGQATLGEMEEYEDRMAKRARKMRMRRILGHR